MNGVHETPREDPENTTDPADPQPGSPPDPRAPISEAPSSEAASAAGPAAAGTADSAAADAGPARPDTLEAEPVEGGLAETDGAKELDESAPLPAEFYRCADERTRRTGIDAARRELARHQVVVMPTDTVYGIAANAFSVQGVRRLLEAKGRDRTMPPPVLIAHAGVLDGLADEISDEARALAAAFWPGGLTLICRAQPSLQWDLGETRGTVGLRVPDDEIARAMLSETGPLAVSSANRTGMPAATTAEQARAMLGDSVRVYLEDGPRAEGRNPDPSAPAPAPAPAPVSSTIVDCTGATPVVVRDGQISLTRLREVVPSMLALDGGAAPAGPDAAEADSAASASGVDPSASGSGSGTGTGMTVDDTVPSEPSQPETAAPETLAAEALALENAAGQVPPTSGSTTVGARAGAPGADAPGAPENGIPETGIHDGASVSGGAVDGEAIGQPATGSTAAEAPAPRDPEADIVEEARAERERAEPGPMDFTAAAPAAASTAAAVVAAGARTAPARDGSVPDQDRSRSASAGPAGRTRPLGLAEASALVAFGTQDEPVEDATGGGAAHDAVHDSMRDTGVDQQR